MVVMVVVMVVVASVLVWAWVWACACCGVVWCGGAIPVSTTATFTKEFSLCAWMCVWVWVCGGASLEVEARRWRWARVTPPRWFGQVQAVRESARRVCL